MSYKDPDKQREAINTCLGCNKAIIQTKGKRQRLWCSDACRIATKRRSEPITEQVNSEQSNTEHSITNKPDTLKQSSPLEVVEEAEMPSDEQREKMRKRIKDPKPELTAQGNIRVSKPGDDDYVPQCETTRAFIEGRDKRPETAKRGKDIKCFADLPPDVQETIHKLSTIDGKIDQRVKANRTAIAINYQHLFPDRYHGTGPWALPGSANWDNMNTASWRAERSRLTIQQE